MVTLTLNDDGDTDIYQIKESFEALDIEKTGRLEIELAYLLLLGLGYITDYKKKDEFNPTILGEAAKRIESVETENYDGVDLNYGIKLETLLKIVATHPGLSRGKRSESFAKRCFELIDCDQKGYIIASDVQRLRREVQSTDRKWNSRQQENEVKISSHAANEIIETTNKIFSVDTVELMDKNGKNENQQRLLPTVFEKMFTPFSNCD